MISVAEATARIVAGMHPLGTEMVSVSAALGRVLALDIAARVTSPPAPVSAMDGYAVRSADVAQAPVTLNVIGESAAGHPFAGTIGRPLGQGEAVRTFTGATVCAGADAVVMQEDTEFFLENKTVLVRVGVKAGTYVRPPGLDFSAGQILLKAGRRLTFRDVGLAAAMNVPWLRVTRRPRIAILSTGDEVKLPGDPIGPGEILGSNGFALSAYVAAQGAVAIDLGIARDDRTSLLALAAGAKGADMLVTSGGVSVGDHDLIQQVLGEAGLEIDFWKVAVRPGKPLVFGRFGDVPLLGLPGNPVSAMVGAMLFLEPALRAMEGLPQRGARQTAVLTRNLAANDSREDYLRATLSCAADGTLRASPFEFQDSAMLATLSLANCLAVRPPNAPAAKAGERIEIVMLDHKR